MNRATLAIVCLAVVAMLMQARNGQEVPGAAGTPGKPRDGRQPLTLTHVANSGVLLATGTNKVLIDALFTAAPPEYRSPDPATLDKMVTGAAPFDEVNLVLVTHNHPDHFDAGMAARYLEAFPKVVLAAPADAVEDLRTRAANWAKLAPRVVVFDLTVGEQATRTVAGFTLTAYRTWHSGQRESPMNLMYSLRFGGWQIFHEGDSDATLDEFREFGLGGSAIDLALVHFWFPLVPETATLLQEVLRPAHIGLTHLPVRLEGDAPGKIDQVRSHYRDIFLLLPGMPVKLFPAQPNPAVLTPVSP